MAVRIDKTNGKFLSRTTFGGSSAGWTVAGWVYAVTKPATSAYYGILYKERSSNQDASEFVNSGGNLKITLWDGLTETLSATLSTATWYHIAVVRESATVIKLYINGALDHTGGTNNIAVKNGIVRLGVWDTSTDVSDCRFAGFKIWDAGLTAAEIAQEAVSLLPVRYANLVGFLPMFPGSGERARDYSGNGNNYTENGTLTDEDPPPVSWGGGIQFLPIVAAAGGTQYNQSAAGTLTSAGSLINQDHKIVAGTLTSSGALVKQDNKIAAGTLTSSGALLRQFNRSIVGTLTSAGALVNQIGKVLSGALTSSGVLVKQTAKSVAGTLSSSGALTTIKAALVSISGTLTSSGALVNQTHKSLSGTLTSSGALVKRTAKSVAGSLMSSGALSAVKAALISIGGTLSSSGTLAKQTSAHLSGTLASAGALVKRTALHLTGTLTSSGALATSTSVAIAWLGRAVAAILGLRATATIGTVAQPIAVVAGVQPIASMVYTRATATMGYAPRPVAVVEVFV